MLSHILAIAVGLGSLSLYLTTFFKPHLHRKDDFILSGLGLFYALVLWTCAGRITGGVLLGQVASVTLISWFVWETLALRGIFTQPDPETVISEVTKSKIEEISLSKLFNQIVNNFNKKPVINNIPTPTISVETPVETSVENTNETVTETVENIVENEEIPTVSFTDLETKIEVEEETVTVTEETTPEVAVQNEEVLEEILEEIPAESLTIKEEVITPVTTELQDNVEIKAVPSPVNMEEKKGFSFSKLITNISGIFNKPKADKIDNISVKNKQDDDDFDFIQDEPKEDKDINFNEIVTQIEDNPSEQVTVIEENTNEIVTEIETIEKIEIVEDQVIEKQEEIKPEINQISSELTELQEANIEEEITIENIEKIETKVTDNVNLVDSIEITETNQDQVIIEENQVILSAEKEEIQAEIIQDIKVEDRKQDQENKDN